MINKNSTKAEVMEAVKQDGSIALSYASEELKGDRDFILEAVQQDWRALKYASKELTNDTDVVKAALSQSWDAVNYASRRIQRNIIQDWLGIKE